MRQFSLHRSTSVLLVGLLVAVYCAEDAAAKTESQYIADGFDYPVGKPDARGYYKARGYYPNGHLGEDWNGKGGGNTDQGDPIYAIGHGVVVYSADFKAGWGNVIIIRHAYREKNGQIAYIDSLYGHLTTRLVREGARVARGEKVGTMGRGPHNMYYAHLHFEIRKNLAVGMYRSDYKRDYSVYHSPTHFIEKYRRLRPEYRRVSIPVDTFRQSNPNLLTMDKVAAPEVAEGGSGGQSAEARPEVPAVVEEVIRTQTDAQTTNTEEKRGVWNRMMGFLGQRRSDKD